MLQSIRYATERFSYLRRCAKYCGATQFLSNCTVIFLQILYCQKFEDKNWRNHLIVPNNFGRFHVQNDARLAKARVRLKYRNIRRLINVNVEIILSEASPVAFARDDRSASDIKIYPKLTVALQRCRRYTRLQLL